ncbi:MAG: hypothetical protein Kow0099_30150 [Candidatus Abyssubacteria bacterium]
MARTFDTRKFLEQWKQRREKEEWLFALAVVKAGLEREGNFDEAAEQEIDAALGEFEISREELNKYLRKHRKRLLQFLDSHPE